MCVCAGALAPYGYGLPPAGTARLVAINHMPINTTAAIAATDVITARRYFRCLCQFSERVRQNRGIAISLLRAPLPPGVEPDIFKVALCGWGEAIFSHAWRACVA